VSREDADLTSVGANHADFGDADAAAYPV